MWIVILFLVYMVLVNSWTADYQRAHRIPRRFWPWDEPKVDE